jgi:hypothetical protein
MKHSPISARCLKRLALLAGISELQSTFEAERDREMGRIDEE